jgi:hypothetical protein
LFGHPQLGTASRSLRSRRRLTESRQRFDEHEDAHGPLPFVFVIDSIRMLFRGGNRHLGFANQLHGLLVHAHYGILGIVRFCVGFQHFYHVGHELRVGFRRDYPVLDFPPAHATFLSVERIVS